MKLYQCTIIAAISLGMTACDPAFIKTVPVDSENSQETIAVLLPAIDAIADDHGFYRSSVPADLEAAVIPDGEHLVAWYDRDEEPELKRGAFVLLAIVRSATNDGVYLKLYAFPAFTEPEQLSNLRLEITNILCSNGFRVEGACGAY